MTEGDKTIGPCELAKPPTNVDPMAILTLGFSSGATDHLGGYLSAARVWGEYRVEQGIIRADQ